jgi:hypothetical protein
MLGRTSFRIATAAALALLALTPGLAQAGTWLKPVPLNLSTVSAPSVAMDAVGDAFAAWQTNPASPPGIVQGARHASGGASFGQQLGDFSTDTTAGHNNSAPLVVTNGSGNGLVVWVNDEGGGTQVIQLRTLAPDGSTGPVQSAPSMFPMGGRSSPVAAINANGDAVVAWLQGTNTIEAITRQGLNGSFTNVATPDVLDSGMAASGPTVAIDKAGNAIAVWPRAGGVLAAKRHPVGGAWAASPDLISPGSHLYSAPDVAANTNGQIVVAFQDFNGVATGVSTISGSVAGGWGPSPSISSLVTAGETHPPIATVDDNGGAVVGWGTPSTVEVSVRRPGGAFPAAGTEQSISVPSIPDSFALAGDGRGDAVATWYTFDTGAGNNIVEAAVKAAGSPTFGAVQHVSDPTLFAGSAQPALDANGDALVAYGETSGGNPAGVSVAEYDSGPVLGTPTGPASVVQSTAAMFSVPQPTDAFSTASVSWNFNDGSAPANGTQVSHAFGTPGSFTVKVTATDAAGQSATASLPVTVTSSGGGGNPPPPPTNCVVPKLKGKTLSQARTALSRAHCALGKVHSPKLRKHQKPPKLVVLSSSPGEGAVRASGTKVALTLGPPPKPKPKKHHSHKK